MISDNELIYLIQDNNEAALNLLYKRYYHLIIKTIKEYKIEPRYWDDYIQEGYMSLGKSLKTYNDTLKCSFYTYFKIILKRDFIRIYEKYNKKTIALNDDIGEINDNDIVYQTFVDSVYHEGLSMLKNVEHRLIYISLYKEGLSPKEIADKYGFNIKRIYNDIQLIKKELNKGFNS